MQSPQVTVRANGTPFYGWEDIQIHAAVKEAARTLHLRVAAELGGAAIAQIFALYAKVEVVEGGEMLFSGYVDHRRPHIDKGSAYIAIACRAKGQDAIDCSCVHDTGRFENKTPLDVAKELDKFGIGFSSDTDLDKIPEYQLKPGATLFREIERLCRDQGVTLAGQGDGSIKLTKAGATAKRQSDELIEGVNFEVIDGDFAAGNRHSDIRVRGQSYDGHGKDAMQIEGKATDTSVPRYRPLILVADGNTDKTRAKKRAQNRRDKAAGDSIRASGRVPGWRDSASTLWTPGNIAWTSSAFLALEQDMLIECADYHQTSKGEGSFTQLRLVDPRAHGGKASRAGKSGDGWGYDDSAGTND